MACKAKVRPRTWRREGVKIREKPKGSGVFHVFVSVAGKRRSVRGGTKEEAEALAIEYRAGMKLAEASRGHATAADFERAGILKPATPTGGTALTFATYAATFLDRNRPNGNEGLKQSTWIDYGQCINGRLGEAFGELALPAIRRRQVKDAEAQWRKAGVKALNIRKHLRILSSILSEAAEDELIDVNPLLNRGRRRRRSKEKQATKTRQNPLTHAELATLLTTAETYAIERRGETVYPYRAALPLILTLVDTGIRLGEAFALRWGDIDWRGGFINVEWSWSKGALSATKSGQRRHVELSARVRAALLAHREAQGFGRVVALDAQAQADIEARRAERMASSLIFPDSEGGYMDDHNLRRRMWEPLITAAGIGHHCLHDLRHTFATLHLDGGTAPTWVSAQLGHHSVAFTLATYVHRPKADATRYADRLANGPQWSANGPRAENDAENVTRVGGLPQSDSVPTPARAASSVG